MTRKTSNETVILSLVILNFKQSGTIKLELVTKIQQIRKNETKSSICIPIPLFLVLIQNETKESDALPLTPNIDIYLIRNK